MPHLTSSFEFQELRRVVTTFDPNLKAIQRDAHCLYLASDEFFGEYIINIPGKYHGKVPYDMCFDLAADLLSEQEEARNLALAVLNPIYQIYLTPSAPYLLFTLELLLKFLRSTPECLNLIHAVRISNPLFGEEKFATPRIEIYLGFGQENAQRLLNILYHKFLPTINEQKCSSQHVPKYSHQVSQILHYAHGFADFKNVFAKDNKEHRIFKDLLFLSLTPESHALKINQVLNPTSLSALSKKIYIKKDNLLSEKIKAEIAKLRLEKVFNHKIKRQSNDEHSVVMDEHGVPYILANLPIGSGVQSIVKIARNYYTKGWVAVKITTFNNKSYVHSEKLWQHEKEMTAFYGSLHGSAIITNRHNQRKGYMFTKLHIGDKTFHGIFSEINTSGFKTKIIACFLANALEMVVALQKVHLEDMVHGNLHEENFIKNVNGTYALVDYGLSVKLAAGKETMIAQCHNSSEAFLSPEIKANLQQAIYSKASDIYALGWIFKTYLAKLSIVFGDFHVHDQKIWQLINKIKLAVVDKMLAYEPAMRLSLDGVRLNIKSLQEELLQLDGTALNSEKLFLAIIANDENAVKELLTQFPELVLFKDQFKRTPIMLANLLQRENILQYLTYVNSNVQRKFTELLSAINANSLDEVLELVTTERYLIQLVEPQNYPLFMACSLGYVDIAMTLINHGASVALTTPQDQTLLHAIAMSGNLILAQTLLTYFEVQQQINAQDSNGNSALHLAIMRQKREIANFLMQKGAFLAPKCQFNIKLLETLEKHQQADLVYKAYVESRLMDEKKLKDLFFKCIKINACGQLKMILKDNPTLHDYLLNSPMASIEYALVNHALEASKTLLELGVEVDLVTTKGIHLLQLALDLNYMELAENIYSKAENITPESNMNYHQRMLASGKSYTPRFASIDNIETSKPKFFSGVKSIFRSCMSKPQ